MYRSLFEIVFIGPTDLIDNKTKCSFFLSFRLFFKVVVPECINRIYSFDDERKLFKSLNIVLFCYQNRHLFCLFFFRCYGNCSQRTFKYIPVENNPVDQL